MSTIAGLTNLMVTLATTDGIGAGGEQIAGPDPQTGEGAPTSTLCGTEAVAIASGNASFGRVTAPSRSWAAPTLSRGSVSAA